MTLLIPVKITNILVAYFCHTATEAQRLKLDEWICASEENMLCLSYAWNRHWQNFSRPHC